MLCALAGGSILTATQRPAFAAQDSEPAETVAESSPPRPASNEPLLARRLRGVSAAVSTQLLGGRAGGVLPLALVALPIPVGAGCCPVRLSIEIDGAAFLEHNRAGVARVEVYVYAIGEGHRIADHLADAFLVDVGARGEAIWQEGLEVHAGLTLPPGSYTLRALVRNFQSGAFGLAEQALDVPDPASTRPALLAPLFPEPSRREGWLPVFSWRGGEDADPAEAEPAIRELTETLGAAAALPVLTAGRPVTVTVVGTRLPAEPKGATSHLMAADGSEEAVPLETTLVESRALTPELMKLRVRLVPPDLPPGRYRLRIALPGPRGELAAPEIPVTLVETSAREGDLRWNDVRRLAGGGPEGAPASAVAAEEEQTKKKRKLSRRRLRRVAEEYREALAAVGTSSDAARAALLDFELGVLGSRDARALELLAGGEDMVVEELAEDAPDALVPLLDLHLDLYRVYRARNLYSLVTHTRLRVESMAERLATTAAPSAPIAAAGALTVLGGELQRATLLSASRRYFDRAAALDGTNVAALLGLATLAEKQGRYGAAVTALERLLAVDPRHGEGRLRLAVNHRRLGADDRGRAILEQLVRDDVPEWIRALARQELALDLVARGSTEEAVSLLEAAADSGEGGGALLLLLANLRDRQRQPRQALALVERAVSTSDPGRASPRWRYDSWPREELDAVHRALRREAAARVPRLRVAVEGTGKR